MTTANVLLEIAYGLMLGSLGLLIILMIVYRSKRR